MMLLPLQSILHFHSFNPSRSDPVPEFPFSFRRRRIRSPALTKAAFKRNVDSKNDKKKEKKPNSCTADELHYVQVDKSDWKVALWRYLPSPRAPTRNHPLMLLSGVGTNAIAYDLSPEVSVFFLLIALHCMQLISRGFFVFLTGIMILKGKSFSGFVFVSLIELFLLMN